MGAIGWKSSWKTNRNGLATAHWWLVRKVCPKRRTSSGPFIAYGTAKNAVSTYDGFPNTFFLILLLVSDVQTATKMGSNLSDYKCKLNEEVVSYIEKPKPFSKCLIELNSYDCNSYKNPLISYKAHGNVICFGRSFCYCSEGYEGTYCEKRMSKKTRNYTVVFVFDQGTFFHFKESNGNPTKKRTTK